MTTCSGAGCPPRIARRALAHATPPPARLRRTIVTAGIRSARRPQRNAGLRGASAARRPSRSTRSRTRLDPLHLTSRYGLFAVMTTTRPEIVFEGSDDGTKWEEYEFRCKPGDLRRPPPWVAPHQPRLDWQMWFAALSEPHPIGGSWRWRGACSKDRRTSWVCSRMRRATGVRRVSSARCCTTTASPIGLRRASTGRWWSRQMLESVPAAAGARPGRRGAPG